MTPVNSIEIPIRFVDVAEAWHGGSNCMLYAVASTGALATGTYCPITDCDDRDRKWYLHLWRELSDAVSEAADAADTAGDDDADLLDKFNWWVGAICIRLAAEYGLTKWRLCNG